MRACAVPEIRNVRRNVKFASRIEIIVASLQRCFYALERLSVSRHFTSLSTVADSQGAAQWYEFESRGHRAGANVGGTDPARSAGKKFLDRAPPLFGSKSTISRFGGRFRDGQHSLDSFLFAVLILTVPPVPSHL